MVGLPEINQNTTLYKLQSLRFQSRRGKTVAMSTIGDACMRKLWYSLHWVTDLKPIPAELQNLFDTGTRAEDFIVRDLELIGIKVTNRQEEIWGFGKHAHGFTDGRCTNVPEGPKTQHLLEIKTHNDKNFKLLVSKGVEKGFPSHYGQVHRYMKALKLTRCLYIGYNKNTSKYHVERIRYDSSYANDLIRKEEIVIMSSVTPNRPEGFTESFYQCGYCNFKQLCYHNDTPVSVTCRTCIHVDMQNEGKWVCTKNGGEFVIPLEIQEKGCDFYQLMPLEI